LRLGFTPTSVTADGTVLTRHSDLGQAGWVFDPVKGVLRVRHQQAKNIIVSGQ
jgi:hypothetical protein